MTTQERLDMLEEKLPIPVHGELIHRYKPLNDYAEWLKIARSRGIDSWQLPIGMVVGIVDRTRF